MVKVDTLEETACYWRQPNCFPGEPVFVPAPDTAAEDGGVLCSLILDGAAGRSFLVVVDARSLAELARIQRPHAAPFGFHGLYLAD